MIFWSIINPAAHWVLSLIRDGLVKDREQLSHVLHHMCWRCATMDVKTGARYSLK